MIPEKAQESINEGVVLATGPGAYKGDSTTDRLPLSVQSGDRVLLPSFGGTSIKVSGEEFHLYRDAEILAVLSK